ncbi:adenine nucleotide alpha hydrolases-like protein [Mollisia scopiformis]|uniref:Diphthine--ammonia ligase n=1 Tax=Mollisia scopiformis TaxID=149040 RepID=A0A194XQJ4_MOLSC|nr:adenine nucleotide alpha hydrolases-like protein [Mollisia scopiformis]KUJ22468.1 adenine nucleotide alpha hydrolases-like protein [Mollisia scopiformis]
MPDSLNVIALISGGKDSFYSLLHCLQNGHKIVALANLYPAPPPNQEDEHDLNSFMYQTVGHTVIPLSERALGIPLYRQVIEGSAVRTGRSYGPVDGEGECDETESLVPLLRRILRERPEANAVCTGAILSTYQRTRIESVAVRLGLVPLAYLWQYPVLEPGRSQSGLLGDMRGVGLEARIVKVASGGLDEGFLWEDVVSERGVSRVERAMRRFGVEGDGGVIGEGGEFETLVVDGPRWLFKGRIEVKEEDLEVVREGGGSAWLRIRDAKVVMKDEEEVVVKECRVPSLLEPRFQGVLDEVSKFDETTVQESSGKWLEKYTNGLYKPSSSLALKKVDHTLFTTDQDDPDLDIEEASKKAITDIRQHLSQLTLEPADIVFTLIILRSMSDFATVNKIYGSLFTQPNPPARVTIACGTLLPTTTDLLTQIRTLKSPTRDALHVQSRSYWAPANIGPYSQAISVPISSNESIMGTYIAGQIPLVPHTMALPELVESGEFMGDFKRQAVLSLQHLWRIAREMRVGWFTNVVAYLPCCADPQPTTIQTQARIASLVWTSIHRKPPADADDEDIDVDLWEDKFFSGKQVQGATKTERTLPDWDMVESPSLAGLKSIVPPFFAVEVEELPRSALIEWHAGLGIVGGRVKLYCEEEDGNEDKWRIYQCVVADSVVHSVVMIPWVEGSERRSSTFEKAISVLGSQDGQAHTAYVDHEASDIKSSSYCGTVVPCRSIWGVSGEERLAAVLLFEMSC